MTLIFEMKFRKNEIIKILLSTNDDEKKRKCRILIEALSINIMKEEKKNRKRFFWRK